MAPRDANWIDGLRGIASFMVVTGHLCTAFVPWLHSPADDPQSKPHVAQLPFVRLLVGGRAAVALFFLITGYVNSLGPIGRSRAGNTEAAFNGIARSALARSGRLILPTFVATALTWFLANMNAYHMTKHVDSTWIRQGWHRREDTLGSAFRSLMQAEVQTWTVGWDEYDGTQWTLHLFLEGSMLVYMIMLATVLVKPRARFVVYAVLYLYFWQLGEGLATGALKGLNIITGIILAELHTHFADRAPTLLPFPLPLLLFLTGAFLAGYPQDAPHNARWSSLMCSLMQRLTPANADIRRYWDHIGASLALLGIFFSRPARSILSSRLPNFLGRTSFPVYLVHNSLIKTLLTWMVYLPSAMSPPRDEQGGRRDLERASTPHLLLAVGVFYYVLYRVAEGWVAYVDPWCAGLVDGAVGWAYGEERARRETGVKLAGLKMPKLGVPKVGLEMAMGMGMGTGNVAGGEKGRVDSPV